MKAVEMIKPLGDRITLRPFKQPAKVGLIHIPDTARKNLLIGKVLAVGDETKSLKPGDVVTYDNYAGLLVDKVNNIMILRESDILGVMEE